MGYQDRQPVVAGTFYPKHPQTLHQDLQTFFAEVNYDDPISGEIVGLIAPHAGYVYSGQVAAYAYKSLKDRTFETVVVIAPSHYAQFAGSSIYDGDGYQTPLGRIPLDRSMIADLKTHRDRITFRPDAHYREHSLEVQLPFLQEALGDFKLVPIVMGDQSWENCQSLAELLTVTYRTRKTLLVASSDLSHFYADNHARALDQVILDHINRFEPRELWEDIARQKCEACGAGPMIAVMLAAKNQGADKARVVKYANSGEVSGDYSRVVGYAAAIITKTS